MHLVLSRVQEPDLDELILAQYAAFEGNPAHDGLFGLNTPEAHDAAKQTFIKAMQGDTADFWLKIVDQDTGKLAAAANWKIYPNWTSVPKPEARPDHNRADQTGGTAGFEAGFEELGAHEVAVKDFVERREKYTHGQPHILLNLLFTTPQYQRHGCGTMMVKWGTDLADRLFVPAWVEGSPAGLHLYKTHGFQDLEYVATKTTQWTVVYHMMRREARHTARMGGLEELSRD